VIAPAALRPGYTRHEGRRFFGANIAHMVEQFDAAVGDLIDVPAGWRQGWQGSALAPSGNPVTQP
jgi:hypothetical protein